MDEASALIATAETDDALAAVLRAHLRIEATLNRYLALRIGAEVAEFVKEPREFGRKLELSVALGLPLPLARASRQLNSIRNKLAHGSSADIDAVDLAEFVRCVNALAALDPAFIPVEKRFLELSVKRPGARLLFGAEGARVDFVLAFFALYIAFSAWLSDQNK